MPRNTKFQKSNILPFQNKILRKFVKNISMKNLTLFLILVFFIMETQAQTLNQIVTDPDIEREILLGQVDETGLANPIFVEDWQDAYDIYAPDKVTVKKLKKIFRKNKDISVMVFFASWCGDSKAHVPDFVKLSHKSKLQNVCYYALSRKKTMPGLDESKYNIERVPTFIVFNKDEEIGRIIETPEVSLAKDLLKILTPFIN